jgi:mannose-1-phosphate guanylyltransferase
MHNPNTFCIIMAGGLGSRFWPLSKLKKPKQFIDLLGTGETLIQLTYRRMTMICAPENIFVITIDQYFDLTKEQLPELPEEQILAEPARRNTAACIAYANEHIKRRNGDANIIVTPADHLITKENTFIEVLLKGLKFVSDKDALLTIGIKPNRPETDYGYIQIEATPELCEITQVKNFTEKPNLELAELFLSTNEFYWNSGIFIWSLNSITKAFEKHLQETQELFKGYNPDANTAQRKKDIDTIYSGCKNVSIDYGILEKADNVFVFCADFGWSDLGTWKTLFENSPKSSEGNILSNNNTILYDTQDTIIKTNPDKITAIQGLEGYIVVETKEALLICKKEEEAKIRQIVNDIKFKKGNEYL